MNNWMDKLPEYCWTILNTTGELVVIKRGQRGYYPQNPENLPYDPATKDLLNERLGVTKAQEKAMSVGSMFGWDVPGSNPDNYDENGEWVKQEAE